MGAPEHRNRHANRGHVAERGVALIGTLITLVILGVMAAVMLNTLGGSPSSTVTTTAVAGATTTTVPATAEDGAQEAAVSACQVNYAALEAAITDYEALNGSRPAAGTAWATSTANGGPYLQAWPESPIYYRIIWDGSTLNVLPARGTASHGTYGTSSPATGCFAA
ncbi:MAG: hypothetical protein ABSC34_11150 [Acidimicrobiales bacterium]|jgi:hypothetical protein